MRYSLRYLWDHYHLPMVITGSRAMVLMKSWGKDGKMVMIRPVLIILESMFIVVGLAIQDGVEVFGFNPWSFTDLLSTGNGMAKALWSGLCKQGPTMT